MPKQRTPPRDPKPKPASPPDGGKGQRALLRDISLKMPVGQYAYIDPNDPRQHPAPSNYGLEQLIQQLGTVPRTDELKAFENFLLNREK